MSSIKKRIAELEVAKTEAEQRTMTNAEIAVRAMAILSNPESPGYNRLVEFFDRRSEVFRKMRLNEPLPERSTPNKSSSS